MLSTILKGLLASAVIDCVTYYQDKDEVNVPEFYRDSNHIKGYNHAVSEVCDEYDALIVYVEALTTNQRVSLEYLLANGHAVITVRKKEKDGPYVVSLYVGLMYRDQYTDTQLSLAPAMLELFKIFIAHHTVAYELAPAAMRARVNTVEHYKREWLDKTNQLPVTAAVASILQHSAP